MRKRAKRRSSGKKIILFIILAFVLYSWLSSPSGTDGTKSVDSGTSYGTENKAASQRKIETEPEPEIINPTKAETKAETKLETKSLSNVETKAQDDQNTSKVESTRSSETKKRTTTTYTVTTTVNIRSGPSTDKEILGKLYEYDHIQVYEINDSWAEFSYSNKSAYVSSKYLKIGELDKPETKAEPSSEKNKGNDGPDYIANKSTKKFHYPDCSSVRDMKEKNKWEFYGTREELISKGYDPCGRCHP